MEAVLKLLREINDKLNILMSHCFIQEGDKSISFMEIYQEMQKSSQPEEVAQPKFHELKEVLNYAARTQKFTIDLQGNMVVDYNGKVYKISPKQRKEIEEG